MDELMEILTNMKPDVDFKTETDLIGNCVFDSMAIVMLVSELCDAFDIEITPPDIIPENFKSAEAIYALVERLQDE